MFPKLFINLNSLIIPSTDISVNTRLTVRKYAERTMPPFVPRCWFSRLKVAWCRLPRTLVCRDTLVLAFANERGEDACGVPLFSASPLWLKDEAAASCGKCRAAAISASSR